VREVIFSMGCLSSRSKSEDQSPPRQIYYDPSENMIVYDGSFVHNSRVEMNLVSSHDSVVMGGGDECYIISADWLIRWVDFAKGISKSAPGEISNHVLIDPNNKMKLRSNIVLKKDYRPVCKYVWEYYFIGYGGGPVIMFCGNLSVAYILDAKL
jgi:hypothetical protein